MPETAPTVKRIAVPPGPGDERRGGPMTRTAGYGSYFERTWTAAESSGRCPQPRVSAADAGRPVGIVLTRRAAGADGRNCGSRHVVSGARRLVE